jgi:myo-inositol-1(or 4)-monophosphatase
MTDRLSDLNRIERALTVAAGILTQFVPGTFGVDYKANHDPVTRADLALDLALREELVDTGEAWLSEESGDSADRRKHERVWVVDPLDGTREFVQGIPEWAVSIGLIEGSHAVAGGILNPAADFLALGALGLGCSLNGVAVTASSASSLDGALILASRTEFGRGEWETWTQANFNVQPMGSVAYKLARVACGLADATWTMVPKNEWDVAGGVALVVASGGWATTLEGDPLRFNRPKPALSGLVAAGPGLLNILTPGWLQASRPAETQ